VRIALATAREARARDLDHAPLAAALAEFGLAAEAPAWDDPSVDWGRYALVLPRATWNYPENPAAFERWVERVSRVTRLLNAPATLRFSADKRYLATLAAQRVAVVPTRYSSPAEPWSPPPFDDYVVKPAIGTDGRGARRFRAGEQDAARAHAAALAAEGSAVLTQPYLGAIERLGETALVYIEGAFSHALRKAPLLRGREAALLDERADITATEAAVDERAVARAALAVVPGGVPLYARVDLVRDQANAPCVLELELVEPSLFLAFAPGSARRLAAAIARVVGVDSGPE
jgi:glutathione synthase/RimK-type ligase-like ATP-grasp enzyme